MPSSLNTSLIEEAYSIANEAAPKYPAVAPVVAPNAVPIPGTTEPTPAPVAPRAAAPLTPASFADTIDIRD